MCIPNNHEELIKELGSTVDPKRKKVLLQLLNTCTTCPEAQEAKKTVVRAQPSCRLRDLPVNLGIAFNR